MNARDMVGVVVGLSPREGYEWPSQTAPIWGAPLDVGEWRHRPRTSIILLIALTTCTLFLAWLGTDSNLALALAVVSLTVQLFVSFRSNIGTWLIKRSLRRYDRLVVERRQRGL